MSRLPLRLRLTAVFVVVMGLALAAIGVFVYLRTEQNIDDSIAQALSSRQSALREFASHPPVGARSHIPAGERDAQLLNRDGTVLESSPAGEGPMLSPAQVRQAVGARSAFERHERVRYLAGPARVDGRTVVAVAATSLAEHEHALEGLTGALVIGGPLALLIGAAIAYAVASGALRPIEMMRRRAASIGRAEPEARLPVPAIEDEVRRLAVTLNEMLARLEESADTERRLVANASHELRTPLAALQAELELALRPGTSERDLRAAAERAHRDVLRLSELSNGLLALSLQEEQPPLIAQPIDAGSLLGDVAADLEHRVSEEGRRIVVRPSSALVHGDPAALRRALTNLVENALVHGDGLITLGADETAHHVAVWVQDEGTIDQSTAGIAFERFARGPDSVTRPGAGLGLALVRTIARQHGGEAVLTGVDGGVRAELRLPLRRGR